MRSMEFRTFVATPARAQRGIVLIVGLLLLLIMAMFALSASQSTRLQERMAGNVRDADLAFQAAESGIRSAENYLWTLAAPPTACAVLMSGCFVFPQATLPQDMNRYAWTSADSLEFGAPGSQEIPNVANDPRYVIEEFERVSETPEEGRPKTWKTYYRITAVGFGGSKTAKALLQSTFTRSF